MDPVKNFEQAFPSIQEDDPFGGFAVTNSKMDSGDPFASTTSETDGAKATLDANDLFAPTYAIDCAVYQSRETDEMTEFCASSAVTPSSEGATNPFLSGSDVDTVEDKDQVSSKTASRTTTPSDLQSSQTEELPWPGYNTENSSEGISSESAEPNSSSSDVAFTGQYSGLEVETSDSSGSSGRVVANIALDSDSGNLTADVRDFIPLPNKIYKSIESEKLDLVIPKVILTEATYVMEKSSFTSADEGRTRLLESTEGESAGNLSRSILTTSSMSDDRGLVQVGNLSTMNISNISSTVDDGEILTDSQPRTPDIVHDFFIGATNGQGEDEGVNQSEQPSEEPREKPVLHSLAKPKTNRVFTSSPIRTRVRSLEPETPCDALTAWRVEFQARIAAKDETESTDIAKLREEAKAELALWYRERKAKIEAQHILHLEHQAALYAKQTDSKSVWQRMASLACDLQRSQKVDEKRKDTSRMKHLLQLLAVKAPIPNQS